MEDRSKTGKLFFQHILHIRVWDIFTGLPAGMLIFMSCVLFSTIAGKEHPVPEFIPLIILGLVSILVGLLCGITRLRQGPATGLAAGVIAGLILGYLWIAARPGDQFNKLVIGPAGILLTSIFTPIGGWIGARIRKVL